MPDVKLTAGSWANRRDRCGENAIATSFSPRESLAPTSLRCRCEGACLAAPSSLLVGGVPAWFLFMVPTEAEGFRAGKCSGLDGRESPSESEARHLAAPGGRSAAATAGSTANHPGGGVCCCSWRRITGHWLPSTSLHFSSLRLSPKGKPCRWRKAMCGRARCSLRHEQVAQAAGVAPERFMDGDKYSPVENMGPGSYAPVVLGDCNTADSSKGGTTLRAMKWGLVPSFTKPNVKPDHFAMFNARSENLRERPAFKRLLQSRRCVVICDGYYEWKQVDKREKQPYYFFKEGSIMKFAALYDTWKCESGEEMYSCTILTTSVAPELSWVHTRMPVILSDEGVSRWLSDAKFESLGDLLVSYEETDLKFHPVDKRLGNVKFQSEDCSKKVDIKHAADIKSFFGAASVKSEPPKVKQEVKSESPRGSKNQGATSTLTSSQISEHLHTEQKPMQHSGRPSPAKSPTKQKTPSKSPSKLKPPAKPTRDPKQATLLQFFRPT